MGSLFRLISQKGVNSLRHRAGVLGNRGCCGARTISSTTASGVSPSPWLMLPPAIEGGDVIYKFYRVGDKDVKEYKQRRTTSSGQEEEIGEKLVVGSSHGWLALFNKRTLDLILSNPISGRTINLPPINTLPGPPVNLKYGVSKLILSHPPEEEECRAMMTFGIGDSLAFCSPGRSAAWTPIGELYCADKFEANKQYARVYDDLVYCSRKKMFICVTQFWISLEEWACGGTPTHFPIAEFEDWDVLRRDSPLRPLRSRPVKFGSKRKPSWWVKNLPLLDNCSQKLHLVCAADGKLFLVLRFVIPRVGLDFSYVETIPYSPSVGSLRHMFPHKTAGFSVFSVDGEGALKPVERSLGGLSMFVGLNNSFALSASQCPGLEPNSIYFTEAKPDSDPVLLERDAAAGRLWYGGHDIGIFNYADKTISPCYYPSDALFSDRIVPEPVWFTPSPLN